MPRSLTSLERAYLKAVKSLPCVLCLLLSRQQMSPTEAHHPRDAAGISQRCGHFCAIALCRDDCHRGPHGIHGDRTYLRMAKVNEWRLHDETNRKVFERWGE